MRKNAIKESCCQFGEHRRLAGVLTEPLDAAPRGALVLINAGFVPKFGPFRLYAQLARRLSSEGFVTLRFDLGGIGDSGRGSENSPLKTRTEEEIRAALDFLKGRYELNGIFLGGLCSGAEDSFRYAEIDDRVTGLMLMDPFGYKTLGWWPRNLLIRIARRSLRLMGRLPPTDNSKALIDYEQMEHSESARILRAMIHRKVRMHFVYTGGMRESFNHGSQFKAMFKGIDFAGLVTLDYFPELRHTQALEADRRSVIESIARRLLSRSPDGAE
jgi:alpha-beta hydrolase superfamily lysophospholipase